MGWRKETIFTRCCPASLFVFRCFVCDGSQADNFLFEAVGEEGDGDSGKDGEEAWGIGGDGGGYDEEDEGEEEDFVDLDAL